MKNFFYAATIIAFSQLLFAQDDNENEVEEGLPQSHKSNRYKY